MGLGQFDEAKECYESLRELGDISSSDLYLKKLAEAQEKLDICINLFYIDVKVQKYRISLKEIVVASNQASHTIYRMIPKPYDINENLFIY